MDISGHWKGYYVQSLGAKVTLLKESQPEDQYPIEVHIKQDGVNISGEMRDHRTEVRRSVSEMLAHFAGCARQGWGRFLARYPDATYNCTLHSESAILGRVKGRKVYFRKTYLKPARYVLVYGDQENVTSLRADVFYVGEISEDGTRIEGYYRMTNNPLKREWRIRQPFSLARQ